MSRAVGRRLVFTAVLLLATSLAASARPIEERHPPGLKLEEVWNRFLEWMGAVDRSVVWGEAGTDVSPNGLPLFQGGQGNEIPVPILTPQ